VRGEEEHLRLPGIRRERPAMAEGDDRARAPVLVVDLRAVLSRDAAHRFVSPVVPRDAGLLAGLLSSFVDRCGWSSLGGQGFVVPLKGEVVAV